MGDCSWEKNDSETAFSFSSCVWERCILTTEKKVSLDVAVLLLKHILFVWKVNCYCTEVWNMKLWLRMTRILWSMGRGGGSVNCVPGVVPSASQFLIPVHGSLKTRVQCFKVILPLCKLNMSGPTRFWKSLLKVDKVKFKKVKGSCCEI